jgi:quercetin dioxygenase-like cupin family protein
MSGALLSFEVASEAERLRARAVTASAGRAAKTLVKEGRLRMTVAALRRGSSLGTHRTEGVSSVQLLRGRATAETGTASVPMRAGSVVVFDEGVEHSLTADSDCELLIVVAMAQA